jgi:hypothetical protein
VDVAMIRTNWATVIQHLRGAGKAVLPSFLEIATPAAFDGATLELVFPPDRRFGVTKVEEREDELRATLQELFGVAPAIKCVVREPVAGVRRRRRGPAAVEEGRGLTTGSAPRRHRGRRRCEARSDHRRLSRLGIGPKSAQRLAFHLVKAPPDRRRRRGVRPRSASSSARVAASPRHLAASAGTRGAIVRCSASSRSRRTPLRSRRRA